MYLYIDASSNNDPKELFSVLQPQMNSKGKIRRGRPYGNTYDVSALSDIYYRVLKSVLSIPDIRHQLQTRRKYTILTTVTNFAF